MSDSANRDKWILALEFAAVSPFCGPRNENEDTVVASFHAGWDSRDEELSILIENNKRLIKTLVDLESFAVMAPMDADEVVIHMLGTIRQAMALKGVT